MSTRSRIGVLNQNGSITSIYCHHDGYLEGVGATLVQHYTDPTKVRALILLGDISSLEAEIGVKRAFDSRDPQYANMTLAYGRDRGEEGTEQTESRTRADFLTTASGSDAEFIYLFDPDTRTWTYSTGARPDYFEPIPAPVKARGQ